MWWEIKSIIRGYNRRSHSAWEQTRLVAYQTYQVGFCLTAKKGDVCPKIEKWLPFAWEKIEVDAPMSQDEAQDIRNMIDDFNNGKGFTW